MFFKNQNFSEKDKQLIYICLTAIVCTFLIAAALGNIKKQDRYVSVRGLSEREVVADQALWPVKASAAANSLGEIYTQIDNSQKSIVSFLQAKGFSNGEIMISQPQVSDRQAQLYYDNNSTNNQRYIAEISVLLKTNKIDQVKKASQEIGELVGKGVTLTPTNVEYVYTKLNEIKPEMIEEATKEARKAADKFARNSGSWIGGIKYAYQGLFSIEPVHQYTQDRKNIRVVTDIEYYLR